MWTRGVINVKSPPLFREIAPPLFREIAPPFFREIAPPLTL